jgi:ADP-ribose pyrophosphatase YjhB (NUDIX family)
MTHIHEKIDFVVNVFIINKGKVLLIHHKELNKWLPIGGHIELDEDPDEALIREIKEECGLTVKILNKKPFVKSANTKPLFTPSFLDIHRINDKHRHISFVYFAKSGSNKVKLAEKEHNDIKWFSKNDVSKIKLEPAIKFYCNRAFEFSE